MVVTATLGVSRYLHPQLDRRLRLADAEGRYFQDYQRYLKDREIQISKVLLSLNLHVSTVLTLFEAEY